jgi:phosphoribosylamine--glycine ligase
MKKNILIIGAGAREHTIGWKLLQSSDVGKLYFAPGNAGTRLIGENVAIKLEDIEGQLQFAKTHDIDFTIVGSEAPLELGIVDLFEREGLHIFGPTQKAALLETSKAWASDFMKRHAIPVPQFRIFDNPKDALRYVEKMEGNCVVKADGLCQGKGVYVCSSMDEAHIAIEELMVKKIFGKSGSRVVIQEKLIGKEISMMAFCDGASAIPLIAAQDYKRIYDGDQGPNTGGMGSVAPANRVSPTLFKKIHRLLTLAVESMREEGVPYHGILYAGVMVVGEDAYIIEFNCRFGDPETQVQLPLLGSDLLPIVEACANGTLTPSLVSWEQKSAVCVVVASGGYPREFETGKIIKGITETTDEGEVLVFHAGTIYEDDQVKTHGGRVLSIVATGESVAQAREKVYRYLQSGISFERAYYRGDIAA